MFKNREVIITSERGEALSKGDWMIFETRGFTTENQATNFGTQLKLVLGVSGFCTRIGVNVGADKPRGYVNEKILRIPGLDSRFWPRPNVHGLEILPDVERGVLLLPSPTLSQKFNLKEFLVAVTECSVEALVDEQRLIESLGLLNQALLAKEPFSKIVLAISAVEALGISEGWTCKQESLLKHLAKHIDSFSDISEYEKEEIRSRIKSLQRSSLSKSVVSLLVSLEMGSFTKEWKRIDRLRGKLFHRQSNLSESEINKLSYDSVRLSGAVVLRAIKLKGNKLPKIALKNFDFDV